MNVTTLHNNSYSYLRQTNEIVRGVVEDNYVWSFASYSRFSSMPDVYMYIIALTEQCNLRCTYCCYSGTYPGNHSHNEHSLCEGDIEKIYSFIENTTFDKPVRISFYGGEPLVNYPLIQYAVNKGYEKWGEKVTFSVSTNGTLLTRERMDWLVTNRVEIAISIDGTEGFHDRHRIDINGNGSFAKVYQALEYLFTHKFQKAPKVVLMLTLTSLLELEAIAKEWQEDQLLRNIPPTHITGLTPNFSTGVVLNEWNTLSGIYLHLLDLYQQHPDWVVLRTFFDEMADIWKNRPVFKVEGEVPLSTCMPVNTKLYIDAHLRLAVCEKINDRFRIGTIEQGIDWDRANELAKAYYDRRLSRCATCPSLRMCNQCLTAMAYNDAQWDILCQNERLNHRLEMFVFCEMAERGMLSDTVFPELETSRCKLYTVGEDDLPALMAIFSDDETQKFLPELCDVAKTGDEIRQIIKSFRTYLKNGEGVLWGIRYDDVLVGFVAIMDIPENPTIFYAMASQYRGKGIMTECVTDVVGWFRQTHPSLPLLSEVYKENVASVKVLEKNGFCQCKEDEIKVYLKFLNS